MWPLTEVPDDSCRDDFVLKLLLYLQRIQAHPLTDLFRVSYKHGPHLYVSVTVVECGELEVAWFAARHDRNSCPFMQIPCHQEYCVTYCVVRRGSSAPNPIQPSCKL